MTNQDTAPSLGGGDLRVGLEALSSLAVRVLNEHTNQAGRCAVYGSAWPCEQASLAEHNLAARVVSRLLSWVGLATCGPCTAGPTLPTARLDSYGRELAGLLERVLAGDLATDWVDVERGVVSALGVLERIYTEHEVDERGRCVICRESRWWPWPRRAGCTVRAAFAFYMPHAATADLRRA